MGRKPRYNESLPTGWPDSQRLYTGACKFFTMCTEEAGGQTFNRAGDGHRPLYTRRNDAGRPYIFSRRDAPRQPRVFPLLSLPRRLWRRVMIFREVDRKNENSSMCRPPLCSTRSVLRDPECRKTR